MTKRNEKCPCGSGLKYKECHGINEPERKSQKMSAKEDELDDTSIIIFSV